MNGDYPRSQKKVDAFARQQHRSFDGAALQLNQQLALKGLQLLKRDEFVRRNVQNLHDEPDCRSGYAEQEGRLPQWHSRVQVRRVCVLTGFGESPT